MEQQPALQRVLLRAPRLALMGEGRYLPDTPRAGSKRQDSHGHPIVSGGTCGKRRQERGPWTQASLLWWNFVCGPSPGPLTAITQGSPPGPYQILPICQMCLGRGRGPWHERRAGRLGLV